MIVPWDSASSKVGTSRPAKKSIQTDVSTTRPVTQFLEVDVEPQLAFESHRFLIGPSLTN